MRSCRRRLCRLQYSTLSRAVLCCVSCVCLCSVASCCCARSEVNRVAPSVVSCCGWIESCVSVCVLCGQISTSLQCVGNTLIYRLPASRTPSQPAYYRIDVMLTSAYNSFSTLSLQYWLPTHFEHVAGPRKSLHGQPALCLQLHVCWTKPCSCNAAGQQTQYTQFCRHLFRFSTTVRTARALAESTSPQVTISSRLSSCTRSCMYA